MPTLTPIDDEGNAITLTPVEEPRVPQAYIDRFSAGTKIVDFFKKTLGPAAGVVQGAYNVGTKLPGAVSKGFLEGFGDEPIGIDPEKEQELYKHLGIQADGHMRPLHFPIAGTSVADLAKGLDAVMRATNGTIRGMAEAAGVIGEEVGQEQGMNERMKRDVNSLGQIAMLLAGAFHPAVPTRLGRGPGRFHDEPIGGLPKPQDFSNAAEAMTGGEVNATIAAKTQQAWQERGIHPAEIAVDAESDPIMKQKLLSSDPAAMPEGLIRTVSPDWNNWADSRQAISTRRLENGDVVPAPGEVASYLENFGREAGFKFQVGPAETIMGGRFGPQFNRLEFQNAAGAKKVQAHVYMPDTPEYMTRQWYGLGRSEILFHEVGHALDYFVLNGGRDTTKMSQISLALRTELTKANKRFAPKLWGENPAYRSRPRELMADGIAAWLSNPEIRKDMPLFTEKYGAKLEKYLDMAERNLPTKVDGEWKMPPGSDEAAAGGGGGNNPPPRQNPFEPPAVEPPPNIPGLRDAQADILSRVSVGEGAKKRGYSFSRLYTDFVDKFRPIERVEESVAAPPERAIDSPYKNARLYAGWVGKADHMIEQGTFDFHTYENNGPALRSILDETKDDLDGFRAFVVAARAKELESRGMATGINPEAVQIVGEAGIKKYGATMEKLVKYQNNVAAYLRDSGVLSDKAYDAMLEANRLFVPFHRVMNEEDFVKNLFGGGLQARNPIKPIEGSNRIIIDPIESVIKNTYLLTQMAEKNVVGTKLVDMLLENEAHIGREGRAPEMSQLPVPVEAAPREVGFLRDQIGHNGGPPLDDLGALLRDTVRGEAEGEIAIYREGRREVYQVGSELAETMKGLNRETTHWLIDLMKPFTTTLRAGAVLDPAFQARHTLRDYTYAFVTTTSGVFTPFDMVRGWVGLMTKDADFWNWQKGGGGQTSFVSLDRRYMQEKLDVLTEKTGLFTRAWNVVIDPSSSMLDKTGAVIGYTTGISAFKKYPLHWLQVATEYALSASHLAAYKKAMRRMETEAPRIEPTAEGTPNLPAVQNAGVPAGREYTIAPGTSLADAVRTDSAGKESIVEAAWVSRNTSIDGQRIGAKMNSVNAISAFANAKVQDTDTILRLIKNNPVKGSFMLAAGITAPSVALWAVNHDDSRYKELPQWEKDIFWHFITDKWEPTTRERAIARISNKDGIERTDQIKITVNPDGSPNWMVNNGTIFRSPKAFGAGIVFGSAAERLLEHYVAEKPDAFKGLLHSLAEATVGDTVPNALAPLVDQAQNRSAFSGRTVIPHNLEGQLPEYQYSPYTTETAKALGKVISALPGIRSLSTDMSSTQAGGTARAVTSPLLIENYIRGWTGSLGMHALELADYGLRKAGIIADPPHAPGTLADLPWIRAFVSRYPSATTQSLSEFYEGAGTAKRYLDTFMAKAKEGDLEALQRVQAMGGNQAMVKLDGYTRVLGEHTKLIHMIDRDPTIEPYEKRQRIDTLYYNMIRLGQDGNTFLKTLKEKSRADEQP